MNFNLNELQGTVALKLEFLNKFVLASIESVDDRGVWISSTEFQKAEWKRMLSPRKPTGIKASDNVVFFVPFTRVEYIAAINPAWLKTHNNS